MSPRKPNSSLSQKAIALLLIVKLMLIGIQTGDRIQQGDAPIEVFIRLINQCVPMLQQISKSENNKK
jgi:hypothetical protein